MIGPSTLGCWQLAHSSGRRLLPENGTEGRVGQVPYLGSQTVACGPNLHAVPLTVLFTSPV
jgi:hypothetical protein